MFRKNKFKRKIIARAREFYNQPFPETTEKFTQLAQIPFTMILSLTPDNILARTFDTCGFEYHSDFYFRNRKASDNFEIPTKQKPLIYNLLGNIEEPESLILTHSDFFDHLSSIFNYQMNEDLKSELENAERYIFLGLPYEKWYFQLLLRWLSIESDTLKEIERLAIQEFEEPHLHKLYETEFKIEFIPTDIDGFINELHKKCGKAGILKEMPGPDPLENTLTDLSTDRMEELIAEAQTAEAMQHLKVLLNRHRPRTQKMFDELILLRNRYNLLRQREQRNTIRAEDLLVENSLVVEQLLALISKTQSL